MPAGIRARIADRVPVSSSRLSLVAAFEFFIALHDLEICRVFAIDLCRVVPLNDIEPRGSGVAKRDDHQFFAGEERVVVRPRFHRNDCGALREFAMPIFVVNWFMCV